jgi:hypothetical protein
MKLSFSALACSALALAAPALAASPAASLRLVTTEPLTVRGAHFRSHERVRVTEHVNKARRSKVVRASATGAFRVVFSPPYSVDPCVESLLVTAVGGRGSDAALKFPQRACPPSP